MLLFWPLARALFAGSSRIALRGTAAVGLLAMCALITAQRADLWGKPEEMAQLWALQNPASSRAQATAASFEARSGRPGQAIQRLTPLLRQHPHDLQLALNYANAACAVRGLAPTDVTAVAVALQHANEGHNLVFRWLDRALGVAADGGCPGLDFSTIESWLAAAAANPIMQGPGRIQDIEALAGRIALRKQQPDQALAHFDRALTAYVTPDAAAMQTAMLASDGHYKQALAHLDHYKRIEHRTERAQGWSMRRLHETVLDAQGYWPYELGLLREKLLAEIAAQSQTTASMPSP
jgi:tetratricopeptide (TPR) repeat protein